jgi:hypothetical protein
VVGAGALPVSTTFELPLIDRRAETVSVVGVSVVREVGWAAGQVLDELREGYFAVAVAADQIGTATAGSRHPLPARAGRCWVEALALVDQAERALSAGIGELRRVPEGRPVATIRDLAVLLTTTHADVDAVAARVGQLRQRVEQGRARLLEIEPGDPAVSAAASQWEAAVVRLDRLIVRLNHGAAALSAYAVGLSGVDPGAGACVAAGRPAATDPTAGRGDPGRRGGGGPAGLPGLPRPVRGAGARRPRSTVDKALIGAALGEPHPPIAGSAQVVTVESVLLLGLLADEDLSRAELDEFLAETGHLCREYPADR